MPVIGRCNDHRINIFVGQKLAIIEVSGGQSAGALLEHIAMWRVHVADRHDLAWTSLVRGVHESFHPLSGADEPEPNLFIRAKNARGGERRHSGCDDEAATIDHVASNQ